MSFNFPASLENDIKAYAHAKHLTPDEAAIQLIQDGLKAQHQKGHKGKLTSSEVKLLRELDPAFSFFEKLPSAVLDQIEEASKQARAEQLTDRA